MTLWALIASLASGGGTLSDLDALRSDPAACRLLELRDVTVSRRMVEFLSKVSETNFEHRLPEGTPVWVRADNAYYSKSFASESSEMRSNRRIGRDA